MRNIIVIAQGIVHVNVTEWHRNKFCFQFGKTKSFLFKQKQYECFLPPTHTRENTEVGISASEIQLIFCLQTRNIDILKLALGQSVRNNTRSGPLCS